MFEVAGLDRGLATSNIEDVLKSLTGQQRLLAGLRLAGPLGVGGLVEDGAVLGTRERSFNSAPK